MPMTQPESCPDCYEYPCRCPCERCGGEGHIELWDAPDLWGEDCCSEVNDLVTCPECGGQG